jgi:hypothetical protein
MPDCILTSPHRHGSTVFNVSNISAVIAERGGVPAQIVVEHAPSVTSPTPFSGTYSVLGATANQIQGVALIAGTDGFFSSGDSITFQGLLPADQGGGGGSLSPIAAGNVLANTTDATAPPSGVTLTSLIDSAIGDTEGDILFRGPSLWSVLAPGNALAPLQSGGTGAAPSYNSNLILPSTGPARFVTGPFINITGPGTAVANTTTPTSLFTGATFRANQSLTIPADSLIAGDEIEITLWGTFSLTASASLQITVFLGGIGIMQSNVVTPPTASVTNGEWMLGTTPTKIWFPSVGTSGTAAGRGAFQGVEVAISNSILSLQMYNLNSAGLGNGALATINTTIALPIDVQATWGTASASNTIQLRAGVIKKSG